MKLIKAIIRPSRVDALKEAFAKIQIGGMTVYRGREYEVTLLPKMQVRNSRA